MWCSYLIPYSYCRVSWNSYIDYLCGDASGRLLVLYELSCVVSTKRIDYGQPRRHDPCVINARLGGSVCHPSCKQVPVLAYLAAEEDRRNAYQYQRGRRQAIACTDDLSLPTYRRGCTSKACGHIGLSCRSPGIANCAITRHDPHKVPTMSPHSRLAIGLESVVESVV